MTRKLYKYQGQEMTAHALSKIAVVSETALRKRLRAGWDVEAAVTTPISENHAAVDPELFERDIMVEFTQHINSVKSEMQPTLNKVYRGRMYHGNTNLFRTKIFCVIHLDNGLPLIVYPDEFNMLGYYPEQEQPA